MTSKNVIKGIIQGLCMFYRVSPGWKIRNHSKLWFWESMTDIFRKNLVERMSDLVFHESPLYEMLKRRMHE